MSLYNVFYNNCRNSHGLIGYFSLSISRHAHDFIIYAMRQRKERAIRQVVIEVVVPL